MTQIQQIKQHLEEYGSITPQEAYSEYGIMRLGARIHELKERGENISSNIIKATNRYGKPVHFAEYRMEK